MSDAIIRIALQSKFNIDSDALNALVDVVHATPNAAVATELLLGVYEEPLINTYHGDSFSTDDMDSITFEGYNRFTDEVFFIYRRVTAKHGWFLKDTEGSEKGLCVSTCHYLDDAAKEIGIDEQTFKATYERRVYERTFHKEWSQQSKSRADWEAFVEKHTTYED